MLAELGWDSYHISRWADALLLSMFAGPAFYKPWRPYRSIQNPHLCCYLQLLKRTKWEKRNLVNTDIHAWVRKKKRLSYVWSVCHARGLFALRFAFSPFRVWCIRASRFGVYICNVPVSSLCVIASLPVLKLSFTVTLCILLPLVPLFASTILFVLTVHTLVCVKSFDDVTVLATGLSIPC